MWEMETVFGAIWRDPGIKRQIRLELRIENVFRFLFSPALHVKLDSCIWCNTSKCSFVITYPGLQVSMCIIGVRDVHIRGSCLSHMLHLRAPPTRRAHLYANANDLCLIYPAVWHFFFLSHYHQKRSSCSKTTTAIFVIPALSPPPPPTSASRSRSLN